MRTAAIILGIITATLLLPQIAFARGGGQRAKADRRKSKVEVVRKPVILERSRRAPVAVRPVIVAPVTARPVVVIRAEKPWPHEVRRESRTSRRGRRHSMRQRPRHEVGRRGHRHHEDCGYIPGRYERRAYEIVVPGYFRNEVVAPIYIERRGPRGFRVKIMVRPAGLRRVWEPPSTITRYEQVWV